MTTPAGGNGFQSGDDFVAARVTIDIPTEGISGLREITQEMDRFRTSVESANRSSETFTGYLQRIAEAATQAATAQENLVAALERNIEYQNRAAVAGAGGGPGPVLNAPGQYTDPFATQSLGMGGSAMGGGGGGDINSQLETLRTENPRAFVNKMAASGQYRAGDIAAASPSGADIQGAADRISQRAGLQQEGQIGADGSGNIGSRAGRMGAIAQQVLSEINPGANGLGVPGMIQRGLGAMGQYGGGAAAGMGLGRMAGLAGPIAGAVGVGMAGYGLVQSAGGIYQDYKNMGLVRGGGAAEGVGYEMSIRAMAMNPFISSDQSRQIIQQGLRDGYTGKEFDTITGMVAQNLKDFNIEVGESFKMLRKNVMEGGQSLPGFASDMESLKQLSRQGYRSLPELQQAYANTSGTLITAGMGGAAAGQAALISGQMFSDNFTLKDIGDQITQGAANNPTMLAMMKYQGGLNAPIGLRPQALPYAMNSAQEGGAFDAAAMNVIKRAAMTVWAGAGRPAKGTMKYYNAIPSFGARLNALGYNFPPNVVGQLFDSMVFGGDVVGDASKKADATKEEQTEIIERNPLSKSGGTFVSGMAALGKGMWDVAANVAGTVKDVFTDNTDNIDDRWGQVMDRMADRGAYTDAASAKYRIKALDIAREKMGSRGIEVIDGKGQVVQLDQNDRQQMEQLSSGQLKVRPRGSTGSGYTLQELPTAAGGDLKQFMGAKTEVSGQVQITLSPEAEKLLRIPGGPTVKLTPHEQQANAGVGTATPNNAPVGEGRR